MQGLKKNSFKSYSMSDVLLIVIGSVLGIFISASIFLIMEGIISIDITQEYSEIHAIVLIVSGASILLHSIYFLITHLSKLN